MCPTKVWSNSGKWPTVILPYDFPTHTYEHFLLHLRDKTIPVNEGFIL